MFAPSLTTESLTTESTLPNEFPYEFASFTSLDDETTEDEDDFLAGLTRRLVTQRKASILQVKPTESTRSGLVSPNGPFSQAPSPPASPFSEEDSLKVISAAAGEVAKIKMATNRPNHFPQQTAAFCYDYSYYYWQWQSQLIQNHQQFQSTLQPTATPFLNAVTGGLPAPNAVSVGTGVFTAVKPVCVGTGVFLPRNYPNPSDSKKISGGVCVKIAAKKIVGPCQANAQAHKKNNNVGGGCLEGDKHLPKEWMY